jgi:hypothetical protein
VGKHGNPARHTFYWLTPGDLEGDLCAAGYGCAYPHEDVIYSTIIPAEHEIVHTEIDAQPPSVLVEGAAEVFGSIGSPWGPNPRDLDPLLDDDRIPGGAYQTAGRFSRFIIERHGLEAYFALYEALDGDAGREALAEATEQTLGIALDDLVASFATTKACSVDRWRYFDHECSAVPLTPWESPTRWRTEIDLSCAADDVIGPRKRSAPPYEGVIWTLRALEVEQAGLYRLELASADASAELGLFSCNANCFTPAGLEATADVHVTTGGKHYFALDTGRHWLRVRHSDQTDAPVIVTIER